MFTKNAFPDLSDLFNSTRTSRFKEGRMLRKVDLVFREMCNVRNLWMKSL